MRAFGWEISKVVGLALKNAFFFEGDFKVVVVNCLDWQYGFSSTSIDIAIALGLIVSITL